MSLFRHPWRTFRGWPRWAQIATVLVVIGVIAGAASSGGSKKSPTSASQTNTTSTPSTAASSTTAAARPARYTLTIRTSPAGSTRLSVHGKTNLPDGAVIDLIAAQAFRFRSEHQIRESQVTHAKRVTVKTGTFSASMGPLDYGDITAGLQQGGQPGFGPIILVDNAVTVCAAFETGANLDGKPRQPDSAVRAAVGANGEYLKTSPQKSVFGSLTPHPSNWLEVTARASVGAQNAAAAVASAQGLAPTLKQLHGFCLS